MRALQSCLSSKFIVMNFLHCHSLVQNNPKPLSHQTSWSWSELRSQCAVFPSEFAGATCMDLSVVLLGQSRGLLRNKIQTKINTPTYDKKREKIAPPLDSKGNLAHYQWIKLNTCTHSHSYVVEPNLQIHIFIWGTIYTDDWQMKGAQNTGVDSLMLFRPYIDFLAHKVDYCHDYWLFGAHHDPL